MSTELMIYVNERYTLLKKVAPMANKKTDEAILLMEERITNMQKMCKEHNITFACAFMARAE